MKFNLLVVLLFCVILGHGQDKSAFSKKVGSIYTPGVTVLKISGGVYTTRINFFAGGEYYLGERFRLSLVGGYLRDRFSEADRILIPIYLEGGYSIIQLKNILFVNAIVGFGKSFQYTRNFEAVSELDKSFSSIIFATEIMVNDVIPNLSLFLDLRQVKGFGKVDVGLEEPEPNSQQIYSIGIKRKF